MRNTRGYRYEDRENDVHKDSSSYQGEDTSADQPRTRNTRKRSTRKRSLLVAGGGLCMLAFVATLVPIIVIFVLKSNSPDEKVSAVNAEVTIKNMDYSDKLADRDTIEYQNFTVLFCKQVKTVFSASNLKDSYGGCIVNTVRNGSLVVDFLVIFVSQDLPARKTVETILSVEVFGIFIFEKSSLVIGEVKQIDANDFLSPRSTAPNAATMSTNTGTISMESTSTTLTTSELATIAISTSTARENATTTTPATTTSPNATVKSPTKASSTINMSPISSKTTPSGMTTSTYKVPSTTTSSLPLSTEPQTIEQQCEKNATLIIPHPTECQLYYNCSFSRSIYAQSRFEQHMQECPYPTQFDIKNMECDDFEKIQCGQRTDKKHPCQYRANQCETSHCIPCAARFPGTCSGKPDGANVMDDRPWVPWSSNYIMCYKERYLSKELSMETCHQDVLGNTMTFHAHFRSCVPSYMLPLGHEEGTMPNCEGREDGQYPYEYGRCNQYAVCRSGVLAAIGSCSGDNVFDALQQGCVDKTNTDELCIGISNCTSTSKLYIQKPTPTLTSTSTTTTTEMTQSLSTGIIREMPTISTLVQSTPNSLPTSTEPQTIEQQCKNNATLIIPDPKKCQLYYNCSVGGSMNRRGRFERHLQECRYPRQFNTRIMKCDDFENVECGNRQDTKDACDYLVNQCLFVGCPRCPFTYPSCDGKPDGANFVNHRPWMTDYVICYKERFVSLEDCHKFITGTQLFFHVNTRSCVPSYMLPQGIWRGVMPNCEGREDGMYLHESGKCNQYIVCKSGVLATIGSCDEGKVFDQSRQNCV